MTPHVLLGDLDKFHDLGVVDSSSPRENFNEHGEYLQRNFRERFSAIQALTRLHLNVVAWGANFAVLVGFFVRILFRTERLSCIPRIFYSLSKKR
jgi:hypothetical protein